MPNAETPANTRKRGVTRVDGTGLFLRISSRMGLFSANRISIAPITIRNAAKTYLHIVQDELFWPSKGSLPEGEPATTEGCTDSAYEIGLLPRNAGEGARGPSIDLIVKSLAGCSQPRQLLVILPTAPSVCSCPYGR